MGVVHRTKRGGAMWETTRVVPLSADRIRRRPIAWRTCCCSASTISFCDPVRLSTSLLSACIEGMPPSGGYARLAATNGCQWGEKPS
jgi:hypothetical protein